MHKSKETRKLEARQRQDERLKRGDAGQLARLDQRGYAAKREREKLAKRKR